MVKWVTRNLGAYQPDSGERIQIGATLHDGVGDYAVADVRGLLVSCPLGGAPPWRQFGFVTH